MVDYARIAKNIAAAKTGFRAAAAAGFDLDRDGCTIGGQSVYPSARDAFVSVLTPSPPAPRPEGEGRKPGEVWWADVALWRDDPAPYVSQAVGMLPHGELAWEMPRPTETAAMHAVRASAWLATRLRSVDIVHGLRRDVRVGDVRVRTLWREALAELRSRPGVKAAVDALREQEEALRRMKRLELGLRAAMLDNPPGQRPFFL